MSSAVSQKTLSELCANESLKKEFKSIVPHFVSQKQAILHDAIKCYKVCMLGHIWKGQWETIF